MNTESFKKFLATGEYVPAMDSAETDLEKHDRRFHPNGFDPDKDTCEFRENRKKGDKSDSSVGGKNGGVKKIKTLIREWSSMFRSHDKPGPEVEFDEDDVFVEACTSQEVPDDALTVYLYSKSGKPTLTVLYNDLLAISPKLAKEAKESHKRKVSAPDPLRGSPS